MKKNASDPVATIRAGLADYLENLGLAGLENWGPFAPTSDTSTGMIQNLQTSSFVVSASNDTSTLSEMPAHQTSSITSSSSQPRLSEHKQAGGQEQLDLLAIEVAACRRCAELAATRTQTVFGTGNPNARLVFLGEAPGAEEDKQGIPFIGRAGQLLTDIITKGMGLAREDVYICNILRCRPPGNRNPMPDEANRCREYLDRTLDVIGPKYICCLGAVAAKNLLQTEMTIGKLRGKVLDYRGIQVICTYHPAYLLRNPAAKKETWSDIRILMKLMGLKRMEN